MTTIGGVAEQLCPSPDLFEPVSGKDAPEAGKKTAKIPMPASDALSGIVKDRAKLNPELTGHDDPVKKAGGTVKNIVLEVFARCSSAAACSAPRTRGPGRGTASRYSPPRG